MDTPTQPTETPAMPPRKALSPRGCFRYSAVELLVVLILLLVTAPLVEDLPGAELVEPILLTVVMISALLAVGGRRNSFVVALVFLVPTLACKWITRLAPTLLPSFFYLVPATIFLAFVVAQLIKFVLRVPRVDANVLCAGISGYLLLGLLWTPLYLEVFGWNPHAFALPVGGKMDGFSAFYFSFMTLCTVGYGDILPVSKAARMLAVVESISGLFYIAVLISRLVAIHSSSPPVQAPPPKPDLHDDGSNAA